MSEVGQDKVDPCWELKGNSVLYFLFLSINVFINQVNNSDNVFLLLPLVLFLELFPQSMLKKLPRR